MTHFASIRALLALLFVACLLTGQAALADEIRIGGSGNALGTMRLLGSAFHRQHPEHNVTLQSSLGSGGAIKAVPRGAIEIGLSTRPLTAEELATGVVVAEYARSPTVVAVASQSRVTGVTREQLTAIFDGQQARWPDGTAIRPVLRQPGEDSIRQIRSLGPALDKALTAAEQRPGLPFAVIDQEAADKIESIPGAVGVITLALILSEGRSLRALALDGVEPTPANAASGAYPLTKRFYALTKPEPSPAVRSFLAFLRSPAARDILARTGHWLP
ncbi:MAG: substrate-binding domain-containing protein [Rhodocyclaceae bacterium]|nr:substrate-binding domain-containing protein [Rhodocyclaceae bacterium]